MKTKAHNDTKNSEIHRFLAITGALITCLQGTSSHAAEENNRCFTEACIEGAAALAQSDFEARDKNLNKEYSRLIRTLNPQQLFVLKNTQRQWLTYRDATCEQIRRSHCSTNEENRECERELESFEAMIVWWRCNATLTSVRTQELNIIGKTLEKKQAIDLSIFQRIKPSK